MFGISENITLVENTNSCDNIVFRNFNSNLEDVDFQKDYIIYKDLYHSPNKGRKPMDYILIVSPEL